MGRLMFFIFMPIIFEFICFLISHFNLDWFDNLKQEIGLFSVLLFVDYIIEFVYLIIIKKTWEFGFLMIHSMMNADRTQCLWFYQLYILLVQYF